MHMSYVQQILGSSGVCESRIQWLQLARLIHTSTGTVKVSEITSTPDTTTWGVVFLCVHAINTRIGVRAGRNKSIQPTVQVLIAYRYGKF
jgi:hypothetical protein